MYINENSARGTIFRTFSILEEDFMAIKLFSIIGYAHLYRSLLRFEKMNINEAKELVYCLNTANLDTYGNAYPDVSLFPSSPVTFCQKLSGNERPYRTEVQLYKSLETLKSNINFDLLISRQREAVQKMTCIMSNLEFNFYKVFDTEIDSPITVYPQCRNHLIPYENEPSVCMFNEWLYLPSA